MATEEGVVRAHERVAASEAVVLETKLTRPPLRPEHVRRGALSAELRTGGARRLTLVTAPPGFGKSTFLAEWATEQDDSTVAWLSLDENDNDPARFLTYVAAALHRVA